MNAIYIESCLQHRRRESLRQDAKLHDESVSLGHQPKNLDERALCKLGPGKADGVLDRACRCVGRGKITITSQ